MCFLICDWTHVLCENQTGKDKKVEMGGVGHSQQQAKVEEKFSLQVCWTCWTILIEYCVLNLANFSWLRGTGEEVYNMFGYTLFNDMQFLIHSEWEKM